ncbi:MAG: ABC transporter ATP-binding protein [Mesorhizobium sp.]|nr:ABC transporter ATP-binding protein [Mesorhizobium sp.]MCO5162031.1 ABC transporter ATP-binding protein [Mesorhizobium sp.]
MNDRPPLLGLEAVSRSFDRGRIRALNDVDLALRTGESVALVGRSGSGKSCLLNIASGLDRPDAGRVVWKGIEVTGRRRWAALRRSSIGIVFQEFHLLPTLTGRQNVELALMGELGRPAGARAERILEQVGLTGMADRLPAELSGGERQRVALARALVREPELLFADEPTGNLDSVNADAVAALMFDLHRQRRMALVIVTHDLALARQCERIVTIVDGSVSDDRSGSGPAA